MSDPYLHVEPPTGAVTGIALVLHGGRSKSTEPVSGAQLAVLRMRPFVTSLRRAGGEHGLAVGRLRYLVRGWNGAQQSPVPDARWGLDQLTARYPGVPIALVGHSMGGRTAVYAAGHDTVTTVVGLAPWIEPGDPYDQLAGRRVLFAHGTLDRMTSAAESRRFADLAAPVTRSMSYVTVAGEGHTMLRRAQVWHHLATGFVMGVLYGADSVGTDDAATTNAVAEALAGQRSLVV